MNYCCYNTVRLKSNLSRKIRAKYIGREIDLPITMLKDASLVVVTKKLNETTDEIVEKFDYDDLCSNITQIAYFRDDPFVCNKYIRCNHGYAQKFKCYRDTAWDIIRKTCLWVNNVDCGERQILDDDLLGENDPDESMKHNGTRKIKTTITTTSPKAITTLSTTTGRRSQLSRNCINPFK